jgi:hypothetical protein
MKTFIALLSLFTLASLTFAAQIGDTVESKIGIAQRIDIPRNVPVEVTHIDLEDGVWAVSGAIQLFEGFINQVAIAAGSLEIDRTTFDVDGTQAFVSVLPGQAFVGLVAKQDHRREWQGHHLLVSLRSERTSDAHSAGVGIH